MEPHYLLFLISFYLIHVDAAVIVVRAFIGEGCVYSQSFVILFGKEECFLKYFFVIAYGG